MADRAILTVAAFLFLAGCSPAPAARHETSVPEAGPAAIAGAEAEVLELLEEPLEYTSVSADLFDRLGWDLPDGGRHVTELAEAAPGGAFDPRALERASPASLGYRARWHEVRYQVYGLDWDIPGLHLTPVNPTPGLPTLVIVHGGSANWYEFFLDPLNQPGLGQYLAQRVPVLLVSIPGNYRHGGWAGNDYATRIPGYLLDRDVSPEEVRVRNAVYTFRVVTDGVRKLIEEATSGPVVIVGHSTGGEVQFLLKDSALRARLGDLTLGWASGGPAALAAMRDYRGPRRPDQYPPVWELRPRPAEGYSRGYLGPLNPLWDPDAARLALAEKWMGLEARRRPQFKQPLQDMEHHGADNLRDHVASQIREALEGNPFGIDPGEVIADLFSTVRAPVGGYRRMIWTVARGDDGHWDEDPAKARTVRVASEFRQSNPDIPIRVLLFDVPMTHYGHVERPRPLAGGLVAALQWLMEAE